MPNILDDIIASVVENKIPAGRQSITTKLSIKHEPVTLSNSILPAAAIAEDAKPDRKKLAHVTAAAPEESTNQYPDVPHCWLNNRRLLWLKDHRNQDNWRLFRECWRQGQVHGGGGSHGNRAALEVPSDNNVCVCVCVCVSSPCWCRGSISGSTAPCGKPTPSTRSLQTTRETS